MLYGASQANSSPATRTTCSWTSIEGETDAFELMDRIIEQVVADKALVESGKARLKRIEARADRTARYSRP